MAEATDYADLEKRLRTEQRLVDARVLFGMDGTTLFGEAASAISALVRERDHWKAEAEAHPIVRMYRGDFSYVELEVGDGDRRGFVPGSDKACLSSSHDVEDT